MSIYKTYTVSGGDTLGEIASAHGVTIKVLITLNEILNPDALQVGQTLRIQLVNETYYIIQSGDNLSKIASAHNVTVGQIMAANNLPDANKISVGQKLIIPAPGNATTASSISPIRELGNLSAKYEVGGRGPGTVSGGQGDPGGVSYGSYQLASKLGNPQKFLDDEGKQWKTEFAGTEQGTDAFSAIWRAVAEREPDLFHDEQHDYIQRTHYEPQVRKIKSICGLDVSTRNSALMDVVWSAAVQHGPNSSMIGNLLKDLQFTLSDPQYDKNAIIAIYGERGRTNAEGVLVHFSSSSLPVQQGVAKRFRNELNDALALLAAESTLEQITPAPDSDSQESYDLLRKAQKTLTDEEMHTLIEKYGDLEAKNEFLNGQKVVVSLRNPSDSKKYHRGTFDDAIIVAWRNQDGSVGLKRFIGNTEPARIYAWGQAKASKGSSTDLDGDGRNDLGRLRAGTYHYQPRAEGNFLGNKAFRARDVQVAMRDVNHDGKFSLVDGDMIDEAGAGRSMLLHQGGSDNDTWSAGCQTIPKRDYNRFLATLGSQTNFSYILINVE